MTKKNYSSNVSEEERKEAKKAQEAYINRIKTEVSLEEVLRRIGLPTRKIGKTSFSRCPYPDHNERTASFAADFRKNLWKCFGCGRGGDMLGIVRDLEAGGDWGETLKWFERNFNLLSPQGMQRQIQARESLKSREPVVELSKALTAPDELFVFYDEVYQALLDDLPLDAYGADEMQSRGVTRDWAERLGYCNLPASFAARSDLAARFAEHFDLENNPVPGFFRLKYKDEFKNWCFGGDGGGSRYLAMSLKEAAEGDSDLPVATLAAAENSPETISDIVQHKYARDYRSAHKIYIGGLLVPQRDRWGRIRAVKIRNQNFTPELWLRSRNHGSRLTGDAAYDYIRNLPAADQENYLAHKDFWIAKYIALASSEEKKGAGALLGIHWSHGAQARRELIEDEFSDEDHLRNRSYSTYQTPIARRAQNPEYPMTMVEPSDAVLWLTEGELKADLIGYFLGVKTAALPGLSGHHFELFWEMGCYGELALKEARQMFDRIEDSRLEWLDFKLNKYKVPVFHGTNVSINSPEVQKKLIFSPLEDQDAAVLTERFSASPACPSPYKSLIIALDEDFSVNVEKSAHRLAWHALHLNMPVLRCRWDGKVGKGLDDLLIAGGEWRLEGLYGKI